MRLLFVIILTIGININAEASLTSEEKEQVAKAIKVLNENKQLLEKGYKVSIDLYNAEVNKVNFFIDTMETLISIYDNENNIEQAKVSCTPIMVPYSYLQNECRK